MKLKERYRNWKESRLDQYNWVAYRIFHPISDRLADSTSYGSILSSAAITTPTRIYISKVLLNAVVIWFIITLLSNLFAIPDIWLTTIHNIANFILSITSIPIIIESIGLKVVGILNTIVSFGTTIEISVVIEELEATIRNIGESITIIGAILLGFVTIFDSILIPLSDMVGQLTSNIISEGSSSVSIDSTIDPLVSLIPPRNQIRNIIAFIIAPLITIFYLIYKILWPKYIASERGRQIDNNLARSYTFMHALSEGGLGIYEVMSKLAKSEDAYGEVSKSFKKIVRNANKGGGSLSSAISETAEETPSEELKSFLNGLTNSIETGSDINAYIESRAERALEDARERQENRLGMYELISEGYIIIFVAAPVFFIILQLVEAMVGSVNRDTAQIVPYLIIPVGGFMISVIIYLTGKQANPEYNELKPSMSSKWYDIEVYGEQKQKYRSNAHKVSASLRKLKSYFLAPIVKVKYNPKLSIIVTAPIALLTILLGIELGYIPTSGISVQEANQIEGVSGEVSLLERMDQNHLSMTIFAIYLPFMIISLPWSILYEMKRRQREKVLSQLPQLFSSIAEANKRGLTLQESIESTAQSSDSKLYNELQKAIRTSKFTKDINGSLIRFANEIRVPRLSQSVRLLVEANRVSSNVTVVVDKIAEDLEAKYSLTRDRKQRARIYVVIVFVAFFIGSAVLIALDVTFFGFIAEEIGANSGGSGGAGEQAPSEASYGQDLPIDFFRRVFIHTLLALAFVSGTVAGMMENGKPANGLKYSILMSTLALLGFILIPEIVA
jgi:flagellar protein FlaJ